MNKLIYVFISIMALASCAQSYNIHGTSNVSALDGRMLFLKVLQDNDFKNIDSSEVVHGQFHFTGTYDSVLLANLFMDDESIMPLVIEEGDIVVKLNNTQMTVNGSPLNDSLTIFFKKYNQIKARQAELIHKHDQAIMDGKDMSIVAEELSLEAERIAEEEDNLITTFVTENFDNVLGPGIFFMMTIGFQYPELTPWVEYIMSKATDKFKNDPYVKDYYQKAQENQQIMNGLKDMPLPAAAPVPPVPQQPVMQAPTPAELATPQNQATP